MSSDFARSRTFSPGVTALAKWVEIIKKLIATCLILFLIVALAPLWLPMIEPTVLSLFPKTEVTVERLLEQAQGDHFYWNEEGEAWSSHDQFWTRHPKRRARSAAIKKLSEFQPLPVNVTAELISMMQNEGDFNSGDGIYGLRSTLCYSLGRAAHDAEAHDAIFELIKKRATSPGLDNSNDIKWFDSSWRHYGDAWTGPAAMVRGLKFTPIKFHAEIEEKARGILEQIEATPRHSKWAVTELKTLLEFFEGKERERMSYLEVGIEQYLSVRW